MTVRELRCPACDAPMSPVERRGVIIDLCRDCKGVFLDRGELDKLLAADAESEPLAAEADRLSRRPERDRDDDDEGWGRDRGRRRRGGFLGDLFDFD